MPDHNPSQDPHEFEEPDYLMADSILIKAMQRLSELMDCDNPETRLVAVDIALGHFLQVEPMGVKS